MSHRLTCLLLLCTFLTGSALFAPRPSQAVSRTIVISEFRTHGPFGEDDDFIELYNLSDSLVRMDGWQVRVAQTRSVVGYSVPIFGGIVLFPGSHYLLKGPSFSGTVRADQGLPAGIPDAVGIGVISPTGQIVDSIGTDFGLYGEGPLLLPLFTNEDRSYERKPGGAAGSTVDTDHNKDDFRVISPSDPQSFEISKPSASGSADPPVVMPGGTTLLAFEVTPGKSPASTGVFVVSDLSAIGGSQAQPFFDDATHGDLKAGDNVFSYQAVVPASVAFGAKTLGAFITDIQGRAASAFIVLDVGAIPEPVRCGLERWPVKTGSDSDARLVDLSIPPSPVTIANSRGWSAPASIPAEGRINPYETTRWVMNATLTEYRKEDDSDYLLILEDASGNTMHARIPCPCCVGAASPFAADIAKARSKFDARFGATNSFQIANVPVLISGIGFFDSAHDKTGAAPNGIELHPVLDITFDVDLRAPRIISASVSGKKLNVYGLNFDEGATVFIGTEKQKSAPDGSAPSTALVAKKAGKKIPRGQTVTLFVRNAAGVTSEAFSFTRPDS